MSVCAECVYYHPKRERKCTLLPRARTEEMDACAGMEKWPDGAPDLRKITREDLKIRAGEMAARGVKSETIARICGKEYAPEDGGKEGEE